MARLVMVRTRLTTGGNTEPVVSLVAQSLKQMGHEVHLLAWDREACHPRRTDETWGTLHRFRYPCPLNEPRAFARRLPLFHDWAAWKTIRLRADLLHCHDLDTLTLGAWLSRFLNVPLVYDNHENYPGLVQGAVGPRWVGRLHYLEARLMRRCAGIIAAGPAGYSRARAMLELGGAAPLRATLKEALAVMSGPDERYLNHQGSGPALTFISNSRSLEAFPTGPLTSAESALLAGLPQMATVPEGDFKLLYVGVLERTPSRGVLETALALRGLPGVRFIVAGFGTLVPRLKQLLPRLDNTTYLGPVDPAVVPALTRHCDAVHLTNDPYNPNNLLANPNKLYEALAAAKPLVTCSELMAGKLALEGGFGVAFDWGDWSALRELVATLRDDPELARHLGQRGRQLFEQRYHWGVMEQRLKALYERVLG